MQYNVLQSENFADSFLHHISESENFSCPFLYETLPSPRGEMRKIKLQKIGGNLLGKRDKFSIHEWNGHLEVFRRPQVIENCRH